MRIAVIGSGTVGKTLAAALSNVGHEVVLGTRSPEDLSGWAKSVRAGADVPRAAARRADLVVNATPGQVSVSVLDAAGLPELDGVVLLDVSNPLDFSTGAPAVYTPRTDSIAEQLQRAFPSARVVKSLCTVNASIMVDPGQLAEPTTQFVAGDDADAKRAVTGLLVGFGWQRDQVIDLGGLVAAREMESNILLWLRQMNALDTVTFNLRLVRGK